MADYTRAPRYLVYNRHKELVTSISSHDSASLSWKWGKDAGAGTITIPGHADPDFLLPALSVDEEPLFVSVYTPSRRPWTGRISNAEYLDDGAGPNLELTLVNDRIWLDAMLAVASPGQPAGQQDREADVREGPLETVVKAYIQAAAGRLRVPVMVVPSATEDASPIIKLSARMVTLSSLFADTLDKYGYSITATTYRTGDPLPPGLQFQPEPGTVLIDVVAGRDNGRLLWQEEHLQTFSVSVSEPQAYRAYVGGEGEGVDRDFHEVVDTAVRDRASNYALPELYEEASGEGADPLEVGREALRKAAGGKSVNFTVADGNPWFLGDDWECGDIAYARIAGLLFRSRITEVEMKDEAGATVIYEPKCGMADPGRREAVADAVARLVADIKRQNAGR